MSGTDEESLRAVVSNNPHTGYSSVGGTNE